MNGKRDGAVVLLSGGLDSSVLAYSLAADGLDVTGLFVHYGQRHSREGQSADLIAKKLGVPLFTIDLAAAGVGAILARSSLVGGDVPLETAASTYAGMRTHFVPNRNVIFLSLAYAAAVTVGASVVAIAVSGIDAPTPDCRPEFMRAFEAMETLALSTSGGIRLAAPFLDADKAAIVKRGQSLGVPFADTWSCFAGQQLHCGVCLACDERRTAFEQSGITDPTAYATGR
jgi:7-cyano-7-deazaguanine synthase